MTDAAELRPLRWMGATREDLQAAPVQVRRTVGFALHEAQRGEKHPKAKPLKGFGGAAVLEIVEDFDGNTWRAVYTVKTATAIYVLHFFQKKSKRGSATPKQELELIRKRLREALVRDKEDQSP
jgi:phage-related protein